MRRHLQRSVAALGHLLSQRGMQIGVFVAALLVAFGAVPRGRLPLALALLVAGRSALLAAEALRGPGTESAGRAFHEPRRPGRELAAEWAGLVAFGLLLPFAFVLFTRDFVSLRSGHGFAASGLAVLCLALYAWPHRWRAVEGVGERRSLWWALPVVPALALVYVGVTVHHPYLDPRAEDRVRLAAERVLELENNVVAGGYADRVFAYADELSARGEIPRAIALYRQGLQLAPRAERARRRLAALERELAPTRREAAPRIRDPRPRAQGLSPAAFARLPFWDGERSLHPVPPCRIDAGLESVPRTTVVLVSLGPVPLDLVRAVGDVLHEELGLPVCRVEEPLPLPDADRIQGVFVGRQWNVDALVRDFWERSRPMPDAPIKYLLLTGADLYREGTRFVFSSSGRFGAVLSYARYGDPDTEWQAVRHRTAKQALGAVVKSFDLPPASDPDCVTSYSNGLPQFDAKGNRPSADTYRKLRERVETQDARWRAYRGARGGVRAELE